MPNENLEAIEAALDALNRRDLDALRERHFHPDAELHSVFGASEGREVLRGTVGVQSWYESMLEAWEQFECGVEQAVDLGSQTFVLLRMHGVGKESGVPVSHLAGVVYTIDSGRIRRFDVFLDPADAFEEMAHQLRAAGG